MRLRLMVLRQAALSALVSFAPVLPCAALQSAATSAATAPSAPPTILRLNAQAEVETFFGTVLKSGPNFVLSDSATKSKYTLDDSREASHYVEMAVKVVGTLDETRNVIHVESIQRIG